MLQIISGMDILLYWHFIVAYQQNRQNLPHVWNIIWIKRAYECYLRQIHDWRLFTKYYLTLMKILIKKTPESYCAIISPSWDKAMWSCESFGIVMGIIWEDRKFSTDTKKSNRQARFDIQRCCWILKTSAYFALSTVNNSYVSKGRSVFDFIFIFMVISFVTRVLFLSLVTR